MKNSTSPLEQFLEELAQTSQPGDRLPTIRDLMRRFGLSQMVVQRVLQDLKDRGAIDSQVGRGTYFQAAGTTTPATSRTNKPSTTRSVLLLRRSISVTRGRVLLERLQQRFAADGHRVLEVSYTDPEHARTVLKGLPRLDACVIQSSFKTITIDLLHALREKTDVLAVDGAALMGADVEAVGMEWGEPLSAAVAMLRQQGHRRIAYATTSHHFLATQLSLRRLDDLQRSQNDLTLTGIQVPHLPDADYASTLVDLIQAQLTPSGRLPFTALVAWGIEDGAQFRSLLAGTGLVVPKSLSVVLLGRTDLSNEHADFFDTVGCSVTDQVECLYEAINARWKDPDREYGIRLIPVSSRAGLSVAPVKAGRHA